MADVIELIEHDHREVEALFSEFEGTQNASVATQICDELDRHASAEEAVVYPVIEAEVPEGKKMVSEATNEHKEARQLIGRIRRTEDSTHLVELVGELKQGIQHHVQEEESQVLPKTRQALSPERLSELGQEFQAAKGS